ncbi:protein of unknown function [Pararobbsia alpina]
MPSCIREPGRAVPRLMPGGQRQWTSAIRTQAEYTVDVMRYKIGVDADSSVTYCVLESSRSPIAVHQLLAR